MFSLNTGKFRVCKTSREKHNFTAGMLEAKLCYDILFLSVCPTFFGAWYILYALLTTKYFLSFFEKGRLLPNKNSH